MATREVLVDDLSGDYGAERVRFAVEDQAWEIDLTEAGRKDLLDAIQRFVDAARPLGTTPVQNLPTVIEAAADLQVAPGALTKEDKQACRRWGQQNAKRLGLDEPMNRGALSRDIINAWLEAGRPEPNGVRA
jgi:hypothetical protein